MMRLFLHIKVIESKLQFYPPFIIDGVTCFDIDNYSSPEVVSTAIKAIDESESLVIFLEDSAASELGSLFKLIKKVKNYQRQKAVYFSSSNPLLLNLLNKTGGEEISKGDLYDKVINFFNRV